MDRYSAAPLVQTAAPSLITDARAGMLPSRRQLRALPFPNNSMRLEDIAYLSHNETGCRLGRDQRADMDIIIVRF
jgi:hypothetical protein